MMADDPFAVRYRAEPSDQLVICPLDDIILIFHARSGMTHMVMAPVPEILSVMGDDRVHAGDVLARLSARFDVSGDDDVLATVAARLDELAALGLVVRA